MHVRVVAIASLLCVLISRGIAADELTPSGAQDASTATIVRPEAPGEKVTFNEAARELTAVYPIHMADFLQVQQNSYNWQGPADASMKCDIGFTPSAVVIKGEFRDDHAFQQPMVRPAKESWWRITYGADGIEFAIDDPTSRAQRTRFVLNWSSQGVSPRVEVLDSPLPRRIGFVPSADMEVFKDATESPTSPNWRFQAVVPFSALADPRLFNRALSITARLHDLDGDMSTYLCMEQKIEKK